MKNRTVLIAKGEVQKVGYRDVVKKDFKYGATFMEVDNTNRYIKRVSDK